MTQISIDKQIEVIKKATTDALKSKESALKFLVDAGIVKEKTESSQKLKEKKK